MSTSRSPPPTHAELAARVSSHREAIIREMNALARLREMVAQAGEA